MRKVPITVEQKLQADAFKQLLVKGWVGLFVFLFYTTQLLGQDKGLQQIQERLDALNKWKHYGCEGNYPSVMRLSFKQEDSSLVFLAFLPPYLSKDKYKVDWKCNATYRDAGAQKVERPEQPDFLINKFHIPVVALDYKKTKMAARKVMPVQEELDEWHAPPPVIKAEIHSLKDQKSFLVEKLYLSGAGRYDSVVVEKVSQVNFYYPLFIRYQWEERSREEAEKAYEQEATAMLKELFASLKVFSKGLRK